MHLGSYSSLVENREMTFVMEKGFTDDFEESMMAIISVELELCTSTNSEHTQCRALFNTQESRKCAVYHCLRNSQGLSEKMTLVDTYVVTKSKPQFHSPSPSP